MWKPYFYKGIETKYLISDDGQVYNTDKNKLVSQFLNRGGYTNVHLHINKMDVKKGVHCLVAETFIPNPENKPQVNHIDGNKMNNVISNLEWVTQSENNIHAVNIGLRKPRSGEGVHFAKYTAEQVEIACKEFEKDELELYEIEKLTGIPVKTLGEIRSGKIWKSISKKYVLPKEHIRQSKIGLKKKDFKRVRKLIVAGYNNQEIYDITGITRTKKISKAMSGMRIKLFKKINMIEDQRLSKAQTECEEELAFAWECSK